MGINDMLKKIIQDESIFNRLYGKNQALIESKQSLLLKLWNKFELLFSNKKAILSNYSMVIVPNRVEILGKHTDYQGGRTILLTGPKSFMAISAKSEHNIESNTYEFVNYEEDKGSIEIINKNNNNLEIVSKGLGWQYSFVVLKRLLNNFAEFRINPVKSIFFGDIPIGGGTSGSSAKVITDFLTITTSNELINNEKFINKIIENGKLAGILYNQPGLDNFKLALSMYIANYENGLDFGNLTGDRGVGTFGGSEDHTAIILGERDNLLICRYCPTRLIRKVKWPEEYTMVVAFSGRKAEKTTNAKDKYNRLSLMASDSVKELNRINGTNFKMLRDFFSDLPLEKRAEKAFKQLKGEGFIELARRSFQFFKEEEIIEKATECLVNKNYNDFGEYINESHRLSKIYLENIVDEIDFLQNEAVKLKAIGSSGFGAGFGGSCYAIAKSNDADSFAIEWKKSYLKKYPQYEKIAEFDIYPPCSGAYWEETNG